MIKIILYNNRYNHVIIKLNNEILKLKELDLMIMISNMKIIIYKILVIII